MDNAKTGNLIRELLKEKGISPDIIYSSPAKRANDTAQIIATEVGYTKPIQFEQKIYESNLFTLKNIIHSIDDKNQVAFLFGHNPGLNIFVEYFCAFYENIPTCGVVQLDFACDHWSEIAVENCNFILFEYPKKYQ